MHFRNFLLNALSESDSAALATHLREVSLSRGQTLYEPGDLVNTLYFPSSACVSIVSVMRSGRLIETATIGRESAAGLLDAVTERPATSRLFIQVAGSALSLPSAIYRRQLAASPALTRLTLRHARALAQQAELSVGCGLAHPAEGRLARWLLMTQDRIGSDILPLTQDYLAIMTGVQRTTVSLMATALRKAGIIGYSRGQMVVLDRQALIERACECYETSERQFEELRDTPG